MVTLASVRNLTEFVVDATARPDLEELLELQVAGPAEIRSITLDDRQLWIITEPVPTASAPGVDLGQLIADELSAVIDQTSLRARMATIDRQELVITATTALVARLAQVGIR